MDGEEEDSMEVNNITGLEVNVPCVSDTVIRGD